MSENSEIGFWKCPSWHQPIWGRRVAAARNP